MALRAGYYGIKRGLKAKLAEIAGAWDATVSSIFTKSYAKMLGAWNQFDPDFTIFNNADGTHVYSDGVLTVTTNNTQYSGAYFGAIVIRNYFSQFSEKRWILSFDYKSDVACKGLIGHKTINSMPTDWTHYEEVIDDISALAGINFYNLDSTETPVIQAKNFSFTLESGAYIPFAASNYKLTDAVNTLNTSASDQKTAINAIISAATGAADFAAFKAAMEAITPVTRSIQENRSTPEVEKVEPEEVIEEPATKKRATKKSIVKEGE